MDIIFLVINTLRAGAPYIRTSIST